MSHSYSPRYERPEYDFKDRYIRSLEEQVSLHKKQQRGYESQLKGLSGRIAHLESVLRAAQCSRCSKPAHHGHRLICEDCTSRDRLHHHQQQVIFGKTMEGSACDSCRIRKRRCDRQKPHCSHCIKIHRNQPGLPKCTYPDKKRKLSDEEEWPTMEPSQKFPSRELTPTSPPAYSREASPTSSASHSPSN